jgi:hypothetical protein
MTARKPKAAPEPQAWFIRSEIAFLERMIAFWTPRNAYRYYITEDARVRHIDGHRFCI